MVGKNITGHTGRALQVGHTAFSVRALSVQAVTANVAVNRV
jgi:hypothetical protein